MPHPQRESRVSLGGALELDQQLGRLIPREQPEQEPLGQPERAQVRRPPQLEEPAVLEDRARLLPAERFERSGPDEVAPPKPAVPLLARDGVSGLVVENGLTQGGEQLGIARRFRCRFGERPVLDRGAGRFQEPRERQPMRGGQLHEIAPGLVAAGGRRMKTGANLPAAWLIGNAGCKVLHDRQPLIDPR